MIRHRLQAVFLLIEALFSLCICYSIPNDGSSCKTDGFGPNRNVPCIFPFKYHRTGAIYTGCTTEHTMRPWCPTSLDQLNTTIGGEWGYCTPPCPRDEQETCRVPTKLTEVLQYGGWNCGASEGYCEDASSSLLLELVKLAPNIDFSTTYTREDLVGLGTVLAFLNNEKALSSDEWQRITGLEVARSALIKYIDSKVEYYISFEDQDSLELVYNSCKILQKLQINPCLTYTTVAQRIVVLLSKDDPELQKEYYKTIDEAIVKHQVEDDLHLIDRCIEAALLEGEPDPSGRDPRIHTVNVTTSYISRPRIYENTIHYHTQSSDRPTYHGRDLEIYSYYDRWNEEYYRRCERGSTCCRLWCRRDQWDYRTRGFSCTSDFCRKHTCRRCHVCECNNYYGWDKNY